MRRALLILWIAIAPIALFTVGCHEPKIKTYEERETQQESEPRMVSPGEPIVE